jgi:CRP-like cAMP-binding protein
MEKYETVLDRVSLFAGISAEEREELFACFRPSVREYRREEVILLEGQEQHRIGIVLSGTIEAEKNTAAGNSVIMTRMQPGDIFGDVLSGGKRIPSPVTITAVTDCTVLFLPYEKLISPCAAAHPAHSRLLQNLVGTIAEKYFSLHRRIDLLIIRSLRGRIARYLLGLSKQLAQTTFQLPLTRHQLAEYLNCDRSALSRELSRMREEGLLEIYQRSVKLLDLERLKHC